MNPELYNLSEKVAVVTGAGRGIGKVLGLEFAKVGLSVVISDKNAQNGEAVVNEICNDRGKALFVKADLSNENDIESIVNETVSVFGAVDIVVNNARPWLRNGTFIESMDDWNVGIDVLLKAPALLTKYAYPYLVESSTGSIVNIGSTNAFTVSHQSIVYHVAKTGLIQLTKYLARELGPDGIRVNCVCPALVDLYDEGRTPLTDDPVNKTIIENIVPLKRAAKAEEIAQTSLFLCSDAAKYITGQTIVLDGGMLINDHFYIGRLLSDMGTGSESDKDTI